MKTEDLLNETTTKAPMSRIVKTKTMTPTGKAVTNYSQRGGPVTLDDTRSLNGSGSVAPVRQPKRQNPSSITSQTSALTPLRNSESATPDLGEAPIMGLGGTENRAVNLSSQPRLGDGASFEKTVTTAPDGRPVTNYVQTGRGAVTASGVNARLGDANFSTVNRAQPMPLGGFKPAHAELQNQTRIDGMVKRFQNISALNRLNHLQKIENMDGRLPASMRKEREQLEAQLAGNQQATAEQANQAAQLQSKENIAQQQLLGKEKIAQYELLGKVNGKKGGSKPPTGFRFVNPSDPNSALEPIPGGPADRLSSESAGKAALLDQGLLDVQRAGKKLFTFDDNGEITGVDRKLLATAQGNVPFTEGREFRSEIMNTIEGKLRIETGAAAQEGEVKRIADRFMPSVLDNDETIKNKMRRLEEFVKFARAKIDPRTKEMTLDFPDDNTSTDAGASSRLQPSSGSLIADDAEIDEFAARLQSQGLSDEEVMSQIRQRFVQQ